MANLCLLGDNLRLHAIARPLIGAYVRSDPSTTPPWSTMLAENTPGPPPAGLPVFVAQGGARMTFREYPTETHGTIADAALPDVMAFLSAGVAGTPPATTC
jgi:hypothetical protein